MISDPNHCFGMIFTAIFSIPNHIHLKPKSHMLYIFGNILIISWLLVHMYLYAFYNRVTLSNAKRHCFVWKEIAKQSEWITIYMFMIVHSDELIDLI